MTRAARALLVSTVIFLLAVWFDLTPYVRGPAPFPPEWRWMLNPRRDVAISGLALGSALGLLVALAATGSAWARARPRTSARALLALAALCGSGLQAGFLASAHPNGSAAALIARTDHPMFTGYFTVAASELAEDPVVLLRRHAQILEQVRVDVEHVETHPPGAILFYRGVIALCEAIPALARAAAPVYDSARVPPLHWFGERDEPRRAAALLSPLLLLFLAAATCWPVAVLAGRLGVAPLEAARIGILWTFVPSVLLMIPEIDQLLTFLGAAATALFAIALPAGRRIRPRADLAACAAGLLAGTAVFVSYGGAFYVAIGVAAVLAACVPRAALGDATRAVSLAALGTVVPWVIPAALGHDAVATARVALGTHFGDFVGARSYALWLVYNLWDFAVFLSIPIAALALARAFDALRVLRDRPRLLAPPARWSLAVAGLILLLDLTGVVRGETGRSWMPLMPFVLVAALARAGSSRAALPTVACSLGLALLMLAQGWMMGVCWQVP